MKKFDRKLVYLTYTLRNDEPIEVCDFVFVSVCSGGFGGGGKAEYYLGDGG